VPYSSAAPESDQLAAWVLARTERLKVMLAHRTGVVHPVHAARAFATLDQLSGGRLGVHFLAGSDAEQEREGDYVDIGCDIVSVRGYDPLDDAVDLARYVLPLVRDELARRTRFAEVTA
jgi:alkanesulfonate monooxygenase SsuD/methylene tetrahydromethanopterin reductase-like flavin-dependent oxidoreductase (luciferase family)